jgi:hypothetical protein
MPPLLASSHFLVHSQSKLRRGLPRSGRLKISTTNEARPLKPALGLVSPVLWVVMSPLVTATRLPFVLRSMSFKNNQDPSLQGLKMEAAGLPLQTGLCLKLRTAFVNCEKAL